MLNEEFVCHFSIAEGVFAATFDPYFPRDLSVAEPGLEVRELNGINSVKLRRVWVNVKSNQRQPEVAFNI